MSKPPPMSAAEHERVRQLHAEGSSLSAIARELGRSPSTISRWAKAQGLSWDAAQTAQATHVKQTSNRDRRAQTIGRLYDRAAVILDRLEAKQFKVVGFDRNGRAKVTHIDSDAIPGNEERALSGMAVNLLVAAARLEAVDAGHANTAEAKGILGGLQDALAAAYGSLAHTRTADLPVDSTDTETQQ